MRTQAEIQAAVETLQCQAAFLEAEGDGNSLACSCCYSNVAFLHWVLGGRGELAKNVDEQLRVWAARIRAEHSRYQRPGSQ